MSQSRRQFIEHNRDKLQSYISKMEDKNRPVAGFGIQTPKEALDEITKKSDDFYLPLCLLFIFWDFPDEPNRNYVLKSLETLYRVDENGIISDTFIAYVYSYCLCKIDEDKKSYDILQILAGQCFPPALATMGDACIANQNIANAIGWYEHAYDHDYVTVIGRHKRLIYKTVPFMKNLPFRLISNIISCAKFFKVIRIGMKGEHALYLDFYGIGYHLKEYWKTPKSKRYHNLKIHRKAMKAAQQS